MRDTPGSPKPAEGSPCANTGSTSGTGAAPEGGCSLNTPSFTNFWGRRSPAGPRARPDAHPAHLPALGSARPVAAVPGPGERAQLRPRGLAAPRPLSPAETPLSPRSDPGSGPDGRGVPGGQEPRSRSPVRRSESRRRSGPRPRARVAPGEPFVAPKPTSKRRTTEKNPKMQSKTKHRP